MDPLRDLVERGRALSERDRDEAARAARATETTETYNARRQLRASLSGYVRWGYIVLGIVTGVALTVSLHLQIAPSTNDDESELPRMLATLAGFSPIILLALLRPFFGARAVAREEEYLRARPFGVVGYLEALGGTRTEGTATLAITFAPAETEHHLIDVPTADFRSAAARRITHATTPPNEETIRLAFRTIGGELRSSFVNEMRIVYTTSFESSVFTNAHLADWLRRAFDILEVIHVNHPIDKVRVDGFN